MWRLVQSRMKSCFAQSPRQSDEEYVDSLRRSIDMFDRWRSWLILLYVTLLVAAVILPCSLIPVALAAMQPANVPFAVSGVLAGVFIGSSIGMLLHKIVSNLRSLIIGMRFERLLIKHYDLVRALPLDEIESMSPEPEIDTGRCS